ncbi:hypothetical protein IDM40_08390 [Nocardiopsis sp. HNM0947]|uniref:AAA+ ATPase domain-containing protein n=1 Tax=Nocardiopsis coralli TaxID=2772213 RepID=A0ABR9P4E6_9ACTN|nr:hypothetical protein [Nocardiopsis coralli]MBE2998719.1 hypothetical protein [Nocardiopsis coralli]
MANTTKPSKKELEKALRADFERTLAQAMERAGAESHSAAGTKRSQENEATTGKEQATAFLERLRRVEDTALRHRLRLQYQPHLVGAAVAATALIAQAAQLAVGPWACAAGTGALMAATLAAVRTRRAGWWAEAGAWLRAHPLRMVLVGSTAWTWMVCSLLVGFDGAHMLATGGLGALVALSAHWWRTHRIAYPEAAAQAKEQAAEEIADVDHIAEAWAANLAAENKPLAGTSLTDYERTQHGHQWTVLLRPGGGGLAELRAKATAISTAIDVDVPMISLERHPTGRPTRAVLRVTVDSPVTDGVPVTHDEDGPVVADLPLWNAKAGDITLGPYADGVGVKSWKTYRPNSLYGGYIFGDTGSGKSELLNLIALGLLASGTTAYWYLDGQEGASSPLVAAHADWDCSESPSKARQALEAACAVMKMRQMQNKAAQAKGFTPSSERPGLVLIIDESHLVLTDYVRIRKASGFAGKSNAELAELIGRTGRKVGVALICASQDTTLKAFGNSGPLRSSLLRGNGVVMFSTNRISAGILPNFSANPADLPDGGGYAYSLETTDATGAKHSRSATFRGAYTEDFGPDLARYPTRVLEEDSATVIDLYQNQAYERRHEITAEAKAEAVGADIDAFKRGEIDINDFLFGNGHTTPAAAATSTTGGDGSALPELAVLPSLSELVNTPAEDDEDLVDTSGLTAVQRAVYEAVSDGISRTRDIPGVIGRSERAVYNAKGVLIEHGLLVQAGRGELALTSRAA